MVFAALGRAIGSGGVIGYTAAGLGPRAGAAAGWCFLVGVVCGAPIVCLIGATYVTDLAGGGQLMRALVASALLLAVLGLALGGVRATTAAQLVLVGLLIAVVVVAVAGSAPAARAASWTPFAPHGWPSIGRAASTLMLSFVGWEAVAPLTARLRDPGRQLPRVIGIAFGTTTLLYLGLAVATIACLGRGAATNVPLAALLELAMGPAGRAVAAVAALILTLGATNAYLSGATEMIGQLTAARGPAGTAGRVTAGRGRPAARAAARATAARGRPATAGAGRRESRAAGHVPADHRGHRASADRALRAAPGDHDGAGDPAHDHVPARLPGLHRRGDPGADRARPARGLARAAGRGHGAGLLRLGPGRRSRRRRHRRRSRRPHRPPGLRRPPPGLPHHPPHPPALGPPAARPPPCPPPGPPPGPPHATRPAGPLPSVRSAASPTPPAPHVSPTPSAAPAARPGRPRAPPRARPAQPAGR